MSANKYIVEGHLNKWRNLRAWGRSLDNVNLIVSDREYPEYPKRAGTCWPELQKVIVYYQPGLKGIVGMLKTGLHELAHAVEGEDGHGFRWQKVYAQAVSEVTHNYVGWGFDPFTQLDEHCYRAMLKWWRRSGNEDAAKRLLGV